MMELYGLGTFHGNSNSKYLVSYSFLLNKQAYKSKIQIITNHCHIIDVLDWLAPDTRYRSMNLQIKVWAPY